MLVAFCTGAFCPVAFCSDTLKYTVVTDRQTDTDRHQAITHASRGKNLLPLQIAVPQSVYSEFCKTTFKTF